MITPEVSEIDIRLLPLAIGFWLGAGAICLTATDRPFVNGTLFALATIAAVCFTLIFAERRIARRFPYARHFAMLGAIGLLASGLLAAARVVPLQAPLFDQLVSSATKVSVTAKVESLPTWQSRSDSFSDAVDAGGYSVKASALEVAGLDGESPSVHRMNLPVQIFGNADSPTVMKELLPGAVISMEGRLAAPRPARAEAAIVNVDDQFDVIERAPPWQQWGATTRASMTNVAKGIDSSGGRLLPGLATGDESQLDETTKTTMRDTGLAHLTAVSGSNIAIVTGLVLLMAAGLRLSRWLSVGLAAIAMFGFVVVVGAQPSVLRATFMASVALLVLALRRERASVPALLASVVVLIAIDPWLSLSYGFGLSVGATAGILAAGFAYRRNGRNLRGAIKVAVVATIAAQVATTPIVAAMGNGLPLIGVVANLLSMPVVPVATVLGMSSALVGLLHSELGSALAQVAALPSSWIIWVAEFCSQVPGGLISWPGGLLGALMVLLVMSVCAIALFKRKLLGPQGAGAAALVALITSLYFSGSTGLSARAWLPDSWSVVMCDVGQGDASVIKSGAGRAVVIDVGPKDQPVADCLDNLGVHTIDLLILSHFHADHVGGIDGAMSRREIRRAIGSPLLDPPGQYERVARKLSQNGVEIAPARPGQKLQVGGVELEVIWPSQLISGRGSDPNNASVVLRASVDSIDVLFPGDVEPAAQERLMAAHPNLHVDVLKVPHHGSKNQNPNLASWSRARWALFSAGARNNYGHPHPLTLKAWSDARAGIARTDTQGAIAIVPVPGKELPDIVAERM